MARLIRLYPVTFDQGGNVWEWNDAVIGTSRGLRGGSWPDDVDNLASSCRNNIGPSLESNYIGFRVASSFSAIPEPTSMLSTLALVSSGLLLRRRTKHLVS